MIAEHKITASALVDICAKDLGLPRGQVSKIVRYLITAGTIPKSRGARVALLDAQHVASVLIALMATDHEPSAPAAVERAGRMALTLRGGELPCDRGSRTLAEFVELQIVNGRDNLIGVNDPRWLVYDRLKQDAWCERPPLDADQQSIREAAKRDGRLVERPYFGAATPLPSRKVGAGLVLLHFRLSFDAFSLIGGHMKGKRAGS